MPADAPLVVALRDRAATDLTVAGGKGANLALLIQHGGFRVPDGFVVTTEAFRAHTDDAALRKQINALDGLDASDAEALAETAAALREAIETRELSEDVREAIENALGERTNYAVRSSATAEDLPGASFAGQHDTFLNVRGAEAVLEKTKACMASLFTDRAAAYRAQGGLSQNEVEMAVVVQEMSAADAAGVLFTADPDTGQRRVAALDAVRGLGEALVSGAANADHARIDRRTGAVLSYETAEEKGTPVLTDARVRELAGLGGEVEALFGGVPQDIEWTLAGGENGGSFHVVQARPITTITPLPEPRPTDGRLHIYLSIGHAQAMTDPMPPLALDLWASVYGDMLNEFVSGPDRVWMARTEGRSYLDFTPMLGSRFAQRGIVEMLEVINEAAADGAARLFEERAGEFGGAFSRSDLALLLGKAAGASPKIARTIWGTFKETVLPFFQGEAGARAYRAWFHEWGRQEEAMVLSGRTPKALAEAAFAGIPGDAVIEMTPKSARVLIGPAMGAVLRWLMPEAEAERVGAAVRGNAEEVGTRMTLSLGDLADTARETPAVEEAVLNERSLDEISRLVGSAAFMRPFDAFLEDFGHRAAGEFDSSRPRWRDDPAGPLGIIRGMLMGEEKGAHRERLRQREQEAAEATRTLRSRARRGPFGGLRGLLVDYLLPVYRAHIHLRDEPKHGAAHLFAAWHEALQRAGQYLATESALDEAADVWYLHREELFALLDDPSGDVPDLEARRAEHERQKRIDVPPLITSEGEVPRAERGEIGEHMLAGTGVSPGVACGPARIVHAPGEANLKAGDILVCPSSDPAWTPLFATAGGLVAEVGGRFTHGALVAREYGLPAVVSVTGATRRIKDGQRIRVDGTQGLVELLDEATDG